MKKGDIVRADLNGYYASSGELFDTTDEALAREKGLWHEGHIYKPRVLILGGESSDIPTGLELDMLKAKVGEKREAVLEPKDAFGAHNPLLVETVSVRELVRLGIEPEVGAAVTRRNRTGYIAGIFGGRVRVDYNHKLAGKALKYEYTIREVAETPEQKVNAILDLHYGRSEEFRSEIHGKSVTIKVPDVCKFDPSWAQQKLRIVLDLREHAGFDTVSYVEEYVKKKAEDEEGAAAAEGEAKAEEKPAAEEHAHEHAHEKKGEHAKEEKPAKAAKAKVKAEAK